jgi:hypothetical protein
VTKEHPAPFSVLKEEFSSMLPFFNLMGLKRDGASLPLNFAAAAVIIVIAIFLSWLTDNASQWIALGIGVYVTFSWAQSIQARDTATFHMIFKSKAMVYTMMAFPSIAFVTYGVGYWTAPLLLRLHDTSPGEVGMYIGLGSAAGGLIGVTMGGVTADWAKRKHPAGRLIIGFIAIFGTAPLVLWMIYTESLMTAFILNFAHHIFSASWPGIPPSTAADLVVPRMRAVAGAFFLLVNTMIGLAMGPYFMGQLSDVYRAGGMDRGESLQTAIATGLLIFVATFFLLILAWRHLPKDESTRLARAREQGEEV